MAKHPPMPATLGDLAASIALPVDIVRRLARFIQSSSATHPVREVVDPALELLAGVIPTWPLLDEWNRWCFEGA
jgi:ABC-type phosphate transport system permease subunit